MAADDLRRRGGDLHRRPRPGRGAGAGAQEGRDARHQGDLHRGPARGVRPRLRLPDDPHERALRGRLPARHLDRPAADRQAAGRDRPRDRRRRHRPRRHRQGQRPGALRAHRLCARSQHQGDRAVARMGVQVAHRPHRLRREEPDPGAQGQARRGAVLGRRQPPALLLRGQGAGGPVGRAAALRLPAHGGAGGRARQGDRGRDRVQERRRGRARRQGDEPGDACSPRSTRSAATTASAGSTWSRTASSA